jgi:hypothetical protein
MNIAAKTVRETSFVMQNLHSKKEIKKWQNEIPVQGNIAGPEDSNLSKCLGVV